MVIWRLSSNTVGTEPGAIVPLRETVDPVYTTVSPATVLLLILREYALKTFHPISQPSDPYSGGFFMSTGQQERCRICGLPVFKMMTLVGNGYYHARPQAGMMDHEPEPYGVDRHPSPYVEKPWNRQGRSVVQPTGHTDTLHSGVYLSKTRHGSSYEPPPLHDSNDEEQ